MSPILEDHNLSTEPSKKTKAIKKASSVVRPSRYINKIVVFALFLSILLGFVLYSTNGYFTFETDGTSQKASTSPTVTRTSYDPYKRPVKNVVYDIPKEIDYGESNLEDSSYVPKQIVPWREGSQQGTAFLLDADGSTLYYEGIVTAIDSDSVSIENAGERTTLVLNQNLDYKVNYKSNELVFETASFDQIEVGDLLVYVPNLQVIILRP